jgi:O-antigen/teichoic acid export membrane protein
MRVLSRQRRKPARIAQNSVYSVLGAGGAFTVTLLATPLLLHRLGTVNFGLWSIAIAAFGLMNALEFGLGTAVAKYVAEHVGAGNPSALSATVTAAVSAYLAVGVVLTLPLFIFAPRASRFFDAAQAPGTHVDSVLRLVSLGLIPMLLLSCGQALAVGLQDFRVPTFASLTQTTLTMTLAVAIVVAGGSVREVVAGSLCVLWIVGLGTLTVGLRLVRRAGATVSFASTHARRLISYVAFTGLTGVGALLFSSVDRVVVGAVVGLRAVAYYAVAIGVANKILFVADVACRPLLPAASTHVGQGRSDLVLAQLRRATVLTTLAVLVLGTTLFVAAEPLLRWWLGQRFAEHAVAPFRILVVIYVLIAVTAPAYHVINGIGLAWVAAAATISGGALTIALIALLGPRLGLDGAAAANGAYCINLALPAVAYAALTRGWFRSRRPTPGSRSIADPVRPRRST